MSPNISTCLVRGLVKGVYCTVVLYQMQTKHQQDICKTSNWASLCFTLLAKECMECAVSVSLQFFSNLFSSHFWPVSKRTLVWYVETVISSFYSESTQVKWRSRVEPRGEPVVTCQMLFFRLSSRSLSSIKLPALVFFLGGWAGGVSCFFLQLGAREALAGSQSQRSPS